MFTGNRYKLLSTSEQIYYKEIVGLIESYKTEWIFSKASYEPIRDAFFAVLDDHPEYFWLSSGCSGEEITYGSEVTIKLRPKYEVEVSRIRPMRDRFDDLTDQLVRTAKRRSSNLYEQILFLHDYIVENTDYQHDQHCYDAYGCLVLHHSVCAGYAAAFQVLMQKLGVECGRVSGSSSSKRTGEVSHAWNYIRLSDGYYFIDVTWDDPIMDNPSGSDNLSHDFFCLDLKELQLTHRISPDQFVPRDYGSKFNYYRYRGWYLDRYSFSAVRPLAEAQLRSSDSFCIKFGSRYAEAEAERDLLGSQKVFSISGIGRNISYRTSRSGLVLSITRKG